MSRTAKEATPIKINTEEYERFKAEHLAAELRAEQIREHMPDYMRNIGNGINRYKLDYLKQLRLVMLTFYKMAGVRSIDLTRITGTHNASREAERYYDLSEEYEQHIKIAKYLKKYITTIESFLKANPEGYDYTGIIKNTSLDIAIKEAEKEAKDLLN